MKVSLGKKGDYAVRAAVFLGRLPAGERRKAREIASAMDVPEHYLPQIMGLLIRGGLVTSVAGPDGGYELARPADEISMLEIVEAAEGPLKSERCVLRGGPCHWDDACAVHPFWFAAQEAMSESLKGSRLSEIVRSDERLEQEYTPTA
jgi:Rrf2 family protein